MTVNKTKIRDFLVKMDTAFILLFLFDTNIAQRVISGEIIYLFLVLLAVCLWVFVTIFVEKGIRKLLKGRLLELQIGFFFLFACYMAGLIAGIW